MTRCSPGLSSLKLLFFLPPARLLSPDKCEAWISVERSSCSVYYLPERLSSFFLALHPHISLFLSKASSLTGPCVYSSSLLFSLSLIFLVGAALPATSRFPSVASSLSSHFQRSFNFDFYCLLLFRAAFLLLKWLFCFLSVLPTV